MNEKNRFSTFQNLAHPQEADKLDARSREVVKLKRKLEVSEKALRSKKSRSSPVCSKRDQSLVQFGFVVTRQEDAERVDVTQEYANVGVLSVSLECGKCGRLFPSQQALGSHMAMHLRVTGRHIRFVVLYSHCNNVMLVVPQESMTIATKKSTVRNRMQLQTLSSKLSHKQQPKKNSGESFCRF